MARIELNRGFEKYGIKILTGEACAYSQRLLCDVNDDGKKLLDDYFSVTINFPSNWNSKVNDMPATGSIMLPSRGDFWHYLGMFVMWHVEKVDIVIDERDVLIGLKEGDEYYEEYLKLYGGTDYIRRNPNYGQPQRNGRNVHAMTGRST